MRTGAALFLLTLILQPLSAGWFKVTARSGLRVRSRPATAAAVLGAVSWGRVVNSVERDKKRCVIGGKTGYWHRISWYGRYGWVFGGFLQRTVPPVDGALSGRLLSWGLGCSGHTYSEYLVVLRLAKGSRLQLAKYFAAPPDSNSGGNGFFTLWEGSWSWSSGRVLLQFRSSATWRLDSNGEPAGTPAKRTGLWLLYRLSSQNCPDTPGRYAWRAPALEKLLHLRKGQSWVDVTRRRGRIYRWLLERMKRFAGGKP